MEHYATQNSSLAPLNPTSSINLGHPHFSAQHS